jgi:hypothetical protein
MNDLRPVFARHALGVLAQGVFEEFVTGKAELRANPKVPSLIDGNVKHILAAEGPTEWLAELLYGIAVTLPGGQATAHSVDQVAGWMGVRHGEARRLLGHGSASPIAAGWPDDIPPKGAR